MEKFFITLTYPIKILFHKIFWLFSKFTGKASDSLTFILTPFVLLREVYFFTAIYNYGVFMGIFCAICLFLYTAMAIHHRRFCENLDRTQPQLLMKFRWFETSEIWLIISCFQIIFNCLLLNFFAVFFSFCFALWSYSLGVFIPSYGKFDYSKITDKVKNLTRSHTPAYNMG